MFLFKRHSVVQYCTPGYFVSEIGYKWGWRSRFWARKEMKPLNQEILNDLRSWSKYFLEILKRKLFTITFMIFKKSILSRYCSLFFSFSSHVTLWSGRKNLLIASLTTILAKCCVINPSEEFFVINHFAKWQRQWDSLILMWVLVICRLQGQTGNFRQKDFKHGQLTHNLLYELNTNQKMIGSIKYKIPFD